MVVLYVDVVSSNVQSKWESLTEKIFVFTYLFAVVQLKEDVPSATSARSRVKQETIRS